MQTEYDNNVLDHWKVPNVIYLVKFKKDDGLDFDSVVKNTINSHLGSLMLSVRIRIMNNFNKENNGFYNISMYYTDTDSLYIETNWGVLDKAALPGDILGQGKNDYKSGGIFYGFFLIPKKGFVWLLMNLVF